MKEIIASRGFDDKKDEIRKKVKISFVNKIRKYLEEKPAKEVPSASSFLARLEALDGIAISIATGGWYESAVLKLSSAGINITDIPIASSNDHFSRTEIMKIAEAEALNNAPISNTYFGDEIWDKKACEELGYNFVLVGNKIKHNQSINDFNSTNEALEYIGLNQWVVRDCVPLRFASPTP